MKRPSLPAAGIVAVCAIIAALAAFGVWRLVSGGDTRETKATASVADLQASASDPISLPVSAEQARQIGLRTAQAVAATRMLVGVAPAVIAPPANARVAVAAIFPGVVLRSHVVEGDMVRKGQPLAEISSRDVLAMSAELDRARARQGVARANADRLRQLTQEGVVAGARSDEAEAQAAVAGSEVAEMSRILDMVNASGGGVYVLAAPIAGRVTHVGIEAGNPVDSATAPYVIDAADQYEASAQLPERLVRAVRPGMAVLAGADIPGEVIAVGSTIDPLTRSASLKARIAADPSVIAGRTIDLSIFAPAPKGAVEIDDAAVVALESGPAVFVAATGGYVVRQVETAGASGGKTVLLSGVAPGEVIVVSGASALKALALSR